MPGERGGAREAGSQLEVFAGCLDEKLYSGYLSGSRVSVATGHMHINLVGFWRVLHVTISLLAPTTLRDAAWPTRAGLGAA
jgi:hypothetical protein